ncbi:MAG: threonine--tRNA ligase [Bacteroidales bacterium]|jgi:threonyl-tRNA synthetase|nr:threonine--tRNA ligase [Bacteroidales bacterium]
MLNITLPDGSIKQYPKGTTPMDIAKSISEGLAHNVLAASISDCGCCFHTIDAHLPLNENAHLKLLTWNDKEGKEVFWHSSAHLLAAAVEEVYPGVKFGIGPAIENGFYYDIDFVNYPFNDGEFEKIEKKFLELAAKKDVFVRKEVSKQEAIDYFTKKGDEYKFELINELEDGKITFYQTGNFIDLCRGPHIPDTSVVKAVKVLALAGAYWRGDEKRKQLTRLYAITFPKQKELTEYLALIEEAKKRDHRKLGKELELFMFSQKVGQGLPIWLPKGTDLRLRLQDFLQNVQKKAGYLQVMTPHIGNTNLYKTSGHFAKYGKDSFQPIQTPEEGEEFMLKPMNCPHHCEIYRNAPHSYKDLPLRYAEFGTVYRYEQSGELHGLTRVRGFTQDDAHIFCAQDQIKDEFKNVIDIVLHIFKLLRFDEYEAQISLRDPNNKEKYIGSDENWEKAENAIIEAAAEKGLKTVTELGEAAFYGPKLDFMVKDALGRRWQLGTIQVDYNLPERFDLEYVGADNEKHRPVMIHRAPFGSMERFVAVLIEHTAGNFPLWLTPSQYMVLPVSDKYIDYAHKVHNQLKKSDLRGSVDDRNETLGKRIREARLAKLPYILIVGEKEEAADLVSVNVRQDTEMKDLGTMNVEDFAKVIEGKIRKLQE